jgi:uncharacterized membrane protein YphA (DoxX/SURF4 family)
MTTKARKIITWILTGIVGFIFIGSGMVKLSGSEDAIQMADGMGINLSTLFSLGIIEIIGAVLFIIPRTGMLGTLLLIAYMGGAMATHIVLGESFLFPALVQVFVWIVACIRFPELPQRMLNGSKGSPQLN